MPDLAQLPYLVSAFHHENSISQIGASPSAWVLEWEETWSQMDPNSVQSGQHAADPQKPHVTHAKKKIFFNCNPWTEYGCLLTQQKLTSTYSPFMTYRNTCSCILLVEMYINITLLDSNLKTPTKITNAIPLLGMY